MAVIESIGVGVIVEVTVAKVEAGFNGCIGRGGRMPADNRLW